MRNFTVKSTELGHPEQLQNSIQWRFLRTANNIADMEGCD